MINSLKHIVNSTWHNVFMRIKLKTVSDHICPPNLIVVSSLLCVSTSTHTQNHVVLCHEVMTWWHNTRATATYNSLIANDL